jgi:hypothetical protein
MGYTTRWYTPDRKAVWIELSSPLTWDEFHEGIRQAHRMIKEESHSIDILVHAGAPMPKGNPLAQFQSAFKQQPSNTGRVIIINPNTASPLMSFIMRLGKILNEIYPAKSKVVFVQSQHEADKLLSAESSRIS